jgi:hypothetical protein
VVARHHVGFERVATSGEVKREGGIEVYWHAAILASNSIPDYGLRAERRAFFFCLADFLSHPRVYPCEQSGWSPEADWFDVIIKPMTGG